MKSVRFRRYFHAGYAIFKFQMNAMCEEVSH